MPSEIESDRYWLAVVAVLAVAAVLYSALVLQRIAVGIGVVVPLVALYLLWRFVRAHERVADALEARAGEP